jgi:two-component system response regulator PilR (NtrC family)
LLKRLATENGDPGYELAESSQRQLSDYPFPGNVRELENILERAVALCDGGVIHPDDLRLPTSTMRAGAVAHGSPGATAATPPAAATLPDRLPDALPDFMESLEREAIQKALVECKYNKTKAAAKLGITFRAMRYKLKKLGIE